MSDRIQKYDPQENEPMQEGPEEAPPFTHTMAIVRWIILGGMTLFALVMILNYFGFTPWAGTAGAAIQYHCPMHPTYIASQPGDCPICGMSLVPIDASGKEIATEGANGDATMSHEEINHSSAKPGQYTCPMDPDVISDKPGRCPKCGMNLIQVPDAAKPGQYTCPMDPDVISDKPGKCPKCGMNLEKVLPATESAQMDHDMSGMDPTLDNSRHGMSEMGSSPVPGLVPVTIEPQRLQLIGMRTGTVSTRSLDGSLRLVGYITPDETRLSNVHVRFSGWVKELAVDQTGQSVSADQKLLSVYSQDLFQAENEYIIARKSAERSADNDLRETRDQLLSASKQRLDLLGVPPDEISRLDTASAPGSELWVRSPFSGYVLDKSVFNGQYIGPGQNLFTIADLSRVWVLADVYERDLENVKIGQTALMTTSAYPGESFTGKISFIYPSVSEQTRTFKIRIEFPNAANRLKPGMYAEVDLAGQGRGVLAVPSDAVMDGGDRQYAFVIHDGNHFEPRLLRIGKRSDDYFEVLSGLSLGEQVVTSANFLIDSESRLKAAIAGMGGTQPDAHAGHGQ